MTRPWKPTSYHGPQGRFGNHGSPAWLSPEDYARLSAREKKQLWQQRQYQRAWDHTPRPLRRKGHYRRQRCTWSLAVFCVTWVVTAAGLFNAPFKPAPRQALASSGHLASFGSCHSGGGTNCVVDGDTFYLAGEKIRIASIDAPETHDYGCASEKALGDRTTVRLRALLNGGPVTLTSIDRDEDVYGRKLRNVAVNGTDVGDTLVNEGLAREYGGGRRTWC